MFPKSKLLLFPVFFFVLCILNNDLTGSVSNMSSFLYSRAKRHPTGEKQLEGGFLNLTVGQGKFSHYQGNNFFFFSILPLSFVTLWFCSIFTDAFHPEAEFKEKHGLWYPMPELTITSPAYLSEAPSSPRFCLGW
jgi:hypothetical protein